MIGFICKMLAGVGLSKLLQSEKTAELILDGCSGLAESGLVGRAGLSDVIRCDESAYLIWKWQPDRKRKGQSKGVKDIRWGSTLYVKEGSVAVFVYPRERKIQQDYIEGPYNGSLKTNDLPFLANALGVLYKGESPFQAEVYFINLAEIIQLKFAVPYFEVYDPQFSDCAVPVAVRGTMNFRIKDYKSFISLHSLDTFTPDDFRDQIKSTVVKCVKDAVFRIPEDTGTSVVYLERKIEQINEAVENKIKDILLQEYGVSVSKFDIAVIDIDKTSEGYRALRKKLTTV